MRGMEAVEVNQDGDGVLRLVERNRESILVMKDGQRQCMILPLHRIEIEMLQVLKRREARKLRRGRIRH